MAAVNATGLEAEVGGGRAARPLPLPATTPFCVVQALPHLLVGCCVREAQRLAHPCLRRSSQTPWQRHATLPSTLRAHQFSVMLSTCSNALHGPRLLSPAAAAGRGPHRPAAAGWPAGRGRQRRHQCRLPAAVRQRCHGRVCHLGATALPHGQVRPHLPIFRRGRMCRQLPTVASLPRAATRCTSCQLLVKLLHASCWSAGATVQCMFAAGCAAAGSGRTASWCRVRTA